MALPIKFKATIKSKLDDVALASKMKEDKKKSSKLNSKNPIDVIEMIRKDVEEYLGKHKSEYRIILDQQELYDYIKAANEFGYISIDTETLGLNPMIHGIVGLCLYFPGQKAVYVPINHVDYFSGNRIEEQLTAEQVHQVLETLKAKIIMHNAQFDIRVIKHSLGILLKCWWDTLQGAILLNENELHGLKYLHETYLSGEKEKTFKEFFGKMPFANVPIELAYIYATHDAVITYDVFDYQYKMFKVDDLEATEEDKEMYWLFRNIEMPMVDVIVSLEDVGVAVDIEYLNSLKDKYHGFEREALNKFYEELEQYSDKIKEYNSKTLKNRLPEKINIGSSAQLATLFYDVIKVKPIKKDSRSTDVDFMNHYENEYSIVKAILAYRKASKITSTYVDNIEKIIHTDGRVHTHFKSNGARTGRMSSSDPLNLQNIPAHNDEVRKMFVGQTTIRNVELRNDNAYIFDRSEEIELNDGTWQWVENIKVGDILSTNEQVKAVIVREFKVLVGV